MTGENYRHHKEKGKHIAEQMTLTELASQMRNSSKSIKRLAAAVLCITLCWIGA